MANTEQLIGQIRFQLEQLSVKNAHHEFEHLCRHLARTRLCSNILPATGPVAAAGDQGRDFESFRTYLEKTDLRGRSTSQSPLPIWSTNQTGTEVAGEV